ncbi:MAG: c-type cytochrome biogenesis protein CcsB [Anaerolineae bacterium]
MGVSESSVLTAALFCVGVAFVAYAAHLARGGRWPGRLGTGASLVGLLALTLGLALRAIEAGHWPLASSYEFALAFVGGIVLVYLVLERALGTRAGGAFILPIALALGIYALTRPESAKAPQPLVPALQSIWFQLHVITAVVAYGAFAAAGGLGVMYLARERASNPVAQLPSLERIDQFTWRAVALGFPWMSLAILLGAIWAQFAWGSYWSWDIKETWALITWLVYLLFLHARALRGWRGRRIAVLSIVGFLAVLFTFLGVGTLARWAGLESLHVY